MVLWVWTGFAFAADDAGDEAITVTLDDVPLFDALRMFERITGLGEIQNKEITKGKSVSANMQDVQWRDALDQLLGEHGFVLLAVAGKEGGYTVATKADALRVTGLKAHRAEALGAYKALTPAAQQRLNRAIIKLGADSYRERNDATNMLKAAGLPALPGLEKAASSDDPEIRERANDILQAVLEKHAQTAPKKK